MERSTQHAYDGETLQPEQLRAWPMGALVLPEDSRATQRPTLTTASSPSRDTRPITVQGSAAWAMGTAAHTREDSGPGCHIIIEGEE